MRISILALALFMSTATLTTAQRQDGNVERCSAIKAKDSTSSVKSQPSTLPIVVFVYRNDMELVFEMDDKPYTRDALNWKLGEMALDGKGRMVVVLIEDSVMLTDLKEIPVMALNAGFRKISVFLIWKKTGGMAEMFLSRKDDNFVEVLFGRVHHATNKPKKLQKYAHQCDHP